MFVKPIFRDRKEAGQVLAERLKPLIENQSAIVLALPRGGVPVGFQIAREIHTDLDVFIVRKIGVPGHEELALGAVATGGVRVLNHAIIRELRIQAAEIDRATERERLEIERRERLYREGRPPLNPAGRTVALVDDGLATGATMLAAVRALRALNPARLIVAVPVASSQTCEEFRAHVDEVICAATPEPFFAVGVWYQNFEQTSDDEVRELLERGAHRVMA
jgi:putative phosphoribosyl transferase